MVGDDVDDAAPQQLHVKRLVRKTEKMMMRLVEIQVVALHPAGLIRKLLLRVRV